MTKRRRRWLWQNVPGQTTNLRGPNRALSLDEQLEVQRIMQQARIDRRRTKTAVVLAARYGVSNRTIYRYAETIAVPPGLENLTMRIKTWAIERQIDLTYDDVATLVYLIQRHRDYRPGEAVA